VCLHVMRCMDIMRIASVAFRRHLSSKGDYFAVAAEFVTNLSLCLCLRLIPRLCMCLRPSLDMRLCLFLVLVLPGLNQPTSSKPRKRDRRWDYMTWGSTSGWCHDYRIVL